MPNFWQQLSATQHRCDPKTVAKTLYDVFKEQFFSNCLRFITLLASAPYYKLYQRGTYKPIKRIIESRADADAHNGLQQWCRYKSREAGYVQVAGAVMFASVISCLSWPVVTTSHWTGPAFFYASIVLAVCSILTGAQQTLVLGSEELLTISTPSEIQDMRRSLVSNTKGNQEPSDLVLFTWQVPIMLLCYCVLTFLAGLCSVVYGPLARELRWNSDSKTALIFTITAVLCLLSWAVASLVVMRLRIPGHLMTDSKWGSTWR